MYSKIIFNRRKKLNSNGEGLVEIEVYVSRSNRKFRSTKIFIDPKFWDAPNLRVKKTHKESDLLNTKLQLMRSEIDNFLLQQKLNSQEMDIAILENKVQTNVTFFDWFENQTMIISNADLSPGTHKLYARTIKYLKEYSKDFLIKEISVSYLEGFNRFLIKKGLAINSRSTLFKKIKKALTLAVKNDVISFSQNPFNRDFKVSEVDVDKQSLTLAELRHLENLDMDLRPELAITRDMFLFACYTAVRYGDLTNLSFENFDLLDNGKIRLRYTPSKTKNSNNKRIEWIISDFWNCKADQIILRYMEMYNSFRDHEREKRLFFSYSNAFYNRSLKELQRFAGLNQKLTSHLARHTCITLLINDFGLDITKAQMIAGHSKMEMTRKYLRITEQDLANAAAKINWE